MTISSTAIDNVSELLNRVLEFTEQRHAILTSNILDYGEDGFVAQDLDVTGFSDCMATAIYEHLNSKRLLLCDKDNIRFGELGCLESEPIVDDEAMSLLETNRELYFEYEMRKLSENLLSSKVATKLLSQRQGQLQ